MAPRGRRLAETAAVAVAGGLLAGATGSRLDLALPAAIVGVANGVLGGWRRIYDWRRPHGPLAFVLDSTWALPMTAAALVPNAVGLLARDAGFVSALSERNNRHVYRRGFRVRPGFAITIGNVISGAGEVERPRRARLVTDHEDVHVWQARWFGPLFPVLYVGWTVVGGVVGAVLWAARRRTRRAGLFATVESIGYFLNPFEWWGYSRDDHWPPGGKVAGLGWQRPCCRPLTVARPHRPSGLAQFRPA